MPQAHHQLGIALAKLGDNEGAANEFSTAIKLDPNMAASWLNLAGIDQAAGKIDQAKETYLEFVRRFPKDPDIGKVRNLIVLLDKEMLNRQNQDKQNASAASALPSKEEPVPGPQLLPSNSVSDYFDEIKNRGVWKWPRARMPLMVFIEPLVPTAARISSGRSPLPDLNAYMQEYISILKGAFLDWVAVSDGLISVKFVDNANLAEIICNWSDDPAMFKDSNEAAKTKLYRDQYGLQQGEIKFLIRSADYSGSLVSKNQMRATSLHEIGHILGLTGHSSNADDVMYFSAPLKNTWLEISKRDKNTLLRVYSEKQ